MMLNFEPFFRTTGNFVPQMNHSIRRRNGVDPADPDRVAGACNCPDIARLVDIFHRHREIRLTSFQGTDDSSVTLRSHPQLTGYHDCRRPACVRVALTDA